MPDNYTLWIHGTAVQVEFPANIASMVRGGWGTDNEQPQGSDNWFHLAVPTPTRMDDDVDHIRLHLLGSIGNKATIDLVTCHRAGEGRLAEWPVSLSAKALDEHFDLPVQQCTKPLVLCVHVSFDGPGNGLISFHGAGADYRER
jgi:hypothetical protein